MVWNVWLFGFNSPSYGGWIGLVVLSGCTWTKSLPVLCPHITACFLNFPHLFFSDDNNDMNGRASGSSNKNMNYDLLMLKKDSRCSVLVTLCSLVCGAAGGCLLPSTLDKG